MAARCEGVAAVKCWQIAFCPQRCVLKNVLQSEIRANGDLETSRTLSEHMPAIAFAEYGK